MLSDIWSMKASIEADIESMKAKLRMTDTSLLILHSTMVNSRLATADHNESLEILHEDLDGSIEFIKHAIARVPVADALFRRCDATLKLWDVTVAFYTGYAQNDVPEMSRVLNRALDVISPRAMLRMRRELIVELIRGRRT